MILSDGQINQIVQEIAGQEEVARRGMAKRRIDIYKDSGKSFLIEKILKEFGSDSLDEMRLVPLNLLKLIVDKRGSIYKKPPVRKTELPSDQALVDYYVEEMDFNVVMAKLNRYLVLSSNVALYIRPYEGELEATVVPSYQYSLVAESSGHCEAGAVVFSSFVQDAMVAPQSAQYSATGVQSLNEQRGYKSEGDLVASNEKSSSQNAEKLIFWTEEQHFTTNEEGSKYFNPEMGQEQFLNPIQEMPVVLVSRDRDNDGLWAVQGEDMIDLVMALQQGWSDLVTIAKNEGFRILTITSEEKPAKMQVGVNRAIWLKLSPNGPQPTIGFVQGNSPLDQYKNLLAELLKLLLATNSMNPGSVGGSGGAQNFTSGFHAMIAMADALEAIESDKPLMLKAEQESWELIKKWHNWMLDMNMLEDEARVLGKFSDEFQVSVQYADARPLESEDERIARVKMLLDMGLLTRMDALKKLHPDLSEEQVAAKLAEIDSEKSNNMKRAQEMFKPKAAVSEVMTSETESKSESQESSQEEEVINEG